MKRFDREEIEKMKYVAKNLMTFFYAVCLSLSGSLRAFLPLVSLFCPFWVSACLSNSPPSGTPPPTRRKCIQILRSAPSSSTGVWAKSL